MTSQEKTRLALIWHRIEKFMFSPANESEQRNWCNCFARSLAEFWGSEPGWCGSGYPFGEFAFPFPGISTSYDLRKWNSNPCRTEMRLMYEKEPFASLDTDHAYLGRLELFDVPQGSLLQKYPNMATRQVALRDDVVRVLDGYMLHPVTHLHAIEDIFGLLWDNPAPATLTALHEVRLAVGMTNPFARLFQFRLQFVMGDTIERTKQIKKQECERVADLVCEAILNEHGNYVISPGLLFGLK